MSNDQLGKNELRSARAHVQRLVTGFRCEIRGCFKHGEWYVTFDDRAFHWCGSHLAQRMHDNKFWETQVKRRAR